MEFNRCYSCMRELQSAQSYCTHCGCNNAAVARSQPAHALPCGAVLNGRYIVGKMLGQGGFGITYIGYDLTMDIEMCIKEYYPDGSAMRMAGATRVSWGNSETAQGMKVGRESFLKEARRAFVLRDLEYVVHVSNMFYENETAYIVMDYIEGETLNKHLLRGGKTLSERESFALLEPVIAELETVHGRGIIHRDIKPDNIMLRTNGKPILLDMGAAKDLSKSGYSQSSALVASHGFSPPEQYQTNGKNGPWTDVYAMCATIYYCVTGHVVPNALDRLGGEKINWSAVSPAVATVLKKGLALKVEDRIQSMGELRRELNAALKGSGKTPLIAALVVVAVVAAVLCAVLLRGCEKRKPDINPLPTATATPTPVPPPGAQIPLLTPTAAPTPEPTSGIQIPLPTATATPVPTAAATSAPEPTPGTQQPPPGPSDMAGYSGIQAPQSTSWLDARETRYVYAPHGAAIYIYRGPSFEYEKVNGNYGVADGTEITLLALENGMYLVKTGNGLLGWISTSGTIETRLIDSMPQLTGSYWIYSKGAGDAYTFACRFDSSKKLVGFRQSDGKKVAWTCRLAGRVLVFDDKKFIWDGEQFAYETQAFLTVDPDQTFDNYS